MSKNSRSNGGSERVRRQRRVLLNYYGPICFYCDRYFLPTELTRDHFIPLAKGGANSLANLVLACEDCNGDKADLVINVGKVPADLRGISDSRLSATIGVLTGLQLDDRLHA